MDISAIIDWCLENGDLAKFYAESMRSSLFSGLLTVSAFVFSVKTFLLMALEKDVYNTTTYRRLVAKMQTLDPKLDRLEPLQNIHIALKRTVWLSFIAAVLQVSLGLLKSNLAAAACLLSAAVALMLIGHSFYVHHVAMQDWFQVVSDKPDPNDAGAAKNDEAGAVGGS